MAIAGRPIRSLYFGAALLCALAAGSAARADARIQLAQAADAVQTNPCRAARREARWGDVLKVPAGLKRDAEAYRKAWREACAKGGGASLHDLLAQATRLSDRFLPLIRKQRVSGPRVDRLHRQLTEVYPTFLPALHGSVMEYEFFEPDISVFRRNAGLGTAEDRAFLEAYPALFGTDFKVGPWLERTWDYGGCLRFGGYDWTAAAQRIDALEARLSGAEYKRRLSALRADMKKTLESLGRFHEAGKPMICACGRTTAVAEDLARFAALLRGNPRYAETVKTVRRKLAAIRDGDILVRSQRVRHCSGG